MNIILSKIEKVCNDKQMAKCKRAKNADVLYTMPTISTLEIICKGLDITMSQFFSDDKMVVEFTTSQKLLLEYWNILPEGKRERALAYMAGLAEK